MTNAVRGTTAEGLEMKPKTLCSLCIAIFAAGLPGIAHAYVGPGAGLSLVAAFWAVLLAVGTIVVFTLMWPIRRMMRRKPATAPADRGRAGAARGEDDGDRHRRSVHGR